MKIIQFIVAGSVAIGSPVAFAASEKPPATDRATQDGKKPAEKPAADLKDAPATAMKGALKPKKNGAQASKSKSIKLNLCDQ
jgi:hypothetical protein